MKIISLTLESLIMAWHMVNQGGSAFTCIKYPNKIGFNTVLAGGFSTWLSTEARNDWMEYVQNNPAYAEYKTAEQRLLSMQMQQAATAADLSWSLVAREKEYRDKEKIMFEVAKEWCIQVTQPIHTTPKPAPTQLTSQTKYKQDLSLDPYHS